MGKIPAALNAHLIFIKKKGSEHIATLNALRGILKYINHKRSRRVLELGIGIGTIPFMLIQARENNEIRHDFNYYGTEDNEFCINQFKANIPGHKNFIKHYRNLSEVPKQKYDFIIIDGRDDKLPMVADLLDHKGTIFIEGGRRSQAVIIEKVLIGRKHIGFSEVSLGRRLGGYTVYFFEPSFLEYLMNLKALVLTPIKYRIFAVMRLLRIRR